MIDTSLENKVTTETNLLYSSNLEFRKYIPSGGEDNTIVAIGNTHIIACKIKGG